MSRYEYGVLSLMAQHPGKLFTKEQIFEAVWQQDSESCLTAVTNTIGRIRSAYYIYKSYGAALYHEMLSVLVDAWGGDSDSFLSGILHGMARFLALYQGEYSRERLVGRLRTVHPKTITRLAQNDTGNVADRHMKQILSIYNGAGRAHSLPCKR